MVEDPDDVRVVEGGDCADFGADVATSVESSAVELQVVQGVTVTPVGIVARVIVSSACHLSAQVDMQWDRGQDLNPAFRYRR